MTAQQEPEHCGHERVCLEFAANPVFGSGVRCTRNTDGCKKCIDDTRSRGPIQRPPEIPSNLLKHLEEAYCCECPKERQATCVGNPCIRQEQIVAEHDAAIAAEARKEALDEFLTKYLEMDKIGICVHPDNEPLECDVSYCGICVALAVRESLRSEVKKE